MEARSDGVDWQTSLSTDNFQGILGLGESSKNDKQLKRSLGDDDLFLDFQNCSTFNSNRWRSPFGAQKSWMTRKSDLRPSLWAWVRFGAFKKAPGDLRGCFVSHCLADNTSNRYPVGLSLLQVLFASFWTRPLIPCRSWSQESRMIA